MNLSEWNSLKKAKLGTRETAGFNLKVSTNKEETIKKIRCVEKCHKCNTESISEVKITFFKPQSLTVFQTGLLYYLFRLNKIPRDYAQYHKCQAGKEFIENIKGVE